MKRKMISVLGISLLLLLVATLATAASSVEFGMDSEIWIAARTDGKAGSGMQNDPYDGSTQEKFDSTMNRLYAQNRKNITIHLGVGIFYTLGSYVYLAYNPSPGWVADDGWKILGAGMGNTILKLAGFTYLDPQQIDVSVTNGIWKTKDDHVYQVGQEIKLVAGAGLTALSLNKIYYVSEMIDGKSFKASETLDGKVLSQAQIVSAGKFQRIGKDAFNTVIANRPWNKRDIEIKDMTIDCNWTGFGTILKSPFIVPNAMGTVTVEVESSAWAKPNKRIYIQQADYRVVGVYEVVSTPDSHKLVLRNLANPHLGAPQPGRPDFRFADNLPPGTSVPQGTRVCPRINVAGIGISATRARIERVRVTNVGAPIYEGNCGINVSGVGNPGPNWPAVSDVVIRDCILDNIWGQYGWPIQIHGNNTDFPSKGYGTQALVEGNTIYGNGLHQGIGGWNYINSLWLNNKVVNCYAAFFTDTPNCWNNLIKNNLFLQCRSYAVILGGGIGVWKAEKSYQQGDKVYWNDINYSCKIPHKGHEPMEGQFWRTIFRPAVSPFNRYVFEGNIFELTDNSGPVLFNGNVSDTIFRNNVIRYAPGYSKGSSGLRFSDPTNRRLIVTGNVIDAGLKNDVGRSVVFGKDNVDEMGRIRPELEIQDAGNLSLGSRPKNGGK